MKKNVNSSEQCNSGQPPKNVPTTTGDSTKDSQRKACRKVVVVDRFDRIPGVSYLTIDGHHVQVSQNTLSLTGWALSNLPSSKEVQSAETAPSIVGALTQYIPLGQRIFLPSQEIKQLVDSSDKSEQVNMVLSLRPQDQNILVSEDSVWTIDPNEPMLQETPSQYDWNRKLFFVILTLAVTTGLTIFSLIHYFVFVYAHGLLLNESFVVMHDEDLRTKDRTLKYNSVHGIVLTTTTLLTTGAGSVLFRVFPKVRKLTLKYIHASCGFIGMLGCIGATILSIYSHKINNVGSFFSLHGFIGIFAMGCYCLQWIGGFTMLLLPFAPFWMKANFIPVHKFFGGAVILLTIPSMATGIVVYTKINVPLKIHATLPPKSMMVNTTGLLVMLFGLTITYLLSDYRFRRRQRPSSKLIDERAIVAVTNEENPNLKCTMSGTGDSAMAGLNVSPET